MERRLSSYTGQLHTGRSWQSLLPGIMTFVLRTGTRISKSGFTNSCIRINDASIWTQ